MSLVEQLRREEVARLFADWSTPAVISRVDQELDSDFDEFSESFTHFEISVVMLPVKSSPTAGTGMQHDTVESDLLLRADELPDDVPLTACRILVGTREWSVIRVTRSGDGRVVQLRVQSS